MDECNISSQEISANKEPLNITVTNMANTLSNQGQW